MSGRCPPNSASGTRREPPFREHHEIPLRIRQNRVWLYTPCMQHETRLTLFIRSPDGARTSVRPSRNLKTLRLPGPRAAVQPGRVDRAGDTFGRISSWLAGALDAAAPDVRLLWQQLQSRVPVQGIAHYDLVLSCESGATSASAPTPGRPEPRPPADDVFGLRRQPRGANCMSRSVSATTNHARVVPSTLPLFRYIGSPVFQPPA